MARRPTWSAESFDWRSSTARRMGGNEATPELEHTMRDGGSMATHSMPSHEREAYRLLHAGFVVAPIVAGLDKFTDKLGYWDRYLADGVAEKLPVRRHTFMQTVGVIEVGAGLLVAAKPKWGGYVVSAWLAAIVANCSRNGTTGTLHCGTPVWPWQP